MSDTLTAETTAPVAAPKVAKPKAKAKPATKKEKPVKEKKDLSGPQMRILAVLCKSSKPLNRNVIAEKAKVDPAAVGNQIGYVDPEVNARPVHANNLINRKFVRFGNDEESRGVVYEVTSTGRKAYESAK